LSCNVAWFGKNLAHFGVKFTAYDFRASALKTDAAVSTEKSIQFTNMHDVASQKTLMSIIAVTTPVVGRHVADRPNTRVILVRVLRIR
jgi:hypothetical protein